MPDDEFDALAFTGGSGLGGGGSLRAMRLFIFAMFCVLFAAVGVAVLLALLRYQPRLSGDGSRVDKWGDALGPAVVMQALMTGVRYAVCMTRLCSTFIVFFGRALPSFE